MTGNNIGHIYATVGADVKSFVAGMEYAQKELNALQKTAKSSMNDVEKTVSRGMDAAADAAAVAAKAIVASLAAIGVGFAALSAKAVKSSAEFEQTQMAFTTMLGSASEATAFLKELESFAARTPFEFPELVKSARMMKAFGIETKEVIPMLTNIGNAAAALGLGGEQISRITLALGQMRAKGKVSGEEMRQLAEAGIPAWQYLATAAGRSVAEVQKLSENGALEANAAIRAIMEGMDREFKGMMEKQSGTLLGLWSTLKDNIGFALRDMGDVIAIPVKAALDRVTQLFAEAASSGALKKAMQDLGRMAADAFTTALEVLGEFVGLFSGIAIGIKETQLAVAVNDLVDATKRLDALNSGGMWATMTESLSAEQLAAKKQGLVDRINTLNDGLERMTRLSNMAKNGFKGMADAANSAVADMDQNLMFAAQESLFGMRFPGGSKKPAGPSQSGLGASIADNKAVKEAMEFGPGREEYYGQAMHDFKRMQDAAVETASFESDLLAEKVAEFRKANDQMVMDTATFGEEIIAEQMKIAAVEDARGKFAFESAAKSSDALRQLALDTATFGEEMFENQKVVEAELLASSQIWKDYADSVAFSLQNMSQLGLDAFKNLASGVGDAFASMIVDGGNFGKALENTFKSVAKMLIARLMEMALFQLIVGKIFGATEAAKTAAGVTGAAIYTAAWSAAQGAALAPFGVAIGLSVAAAMGQFNAAVAAGTANGSALGAVAASATMIAGDAALASGGSFHGGMGYVPKEQSYFLDEGERVLAPKQNQDLTAFLHSPFVAQGMAKGFSSGGGNSPAPAASSDSGGFTNVIQVDGEVLAKVVTRRVKRGVSAGRTSLVSARA